MCTKNSAIFGPPCTYIQRCGLGLDVYIILDKMLNMSVLSQSRNCLSKVLMSAYTYHTQECGMDFSISISRHTNVSSQSCLEQNAQCLSLLLVLKQCVSSLVSVLAHEVSASHAKPRTTLSGQDILCRHAPRTASVLQYKQSRPIPCASDLLNCF